MILTRRQTPFFHSCDAWSPLITEFHQLLQAFAFFLEMLDLGIEPAPSGFRESTWTARCFQLFLLLPNIPPGIPPGIPPFIPCAARIVIIASAFGLLVNIVTTPGQTLLFWVPLPTDPNGLLRVQRVRSCIEKESWQFLNLSTKFQQEFMRNRRVRLIDWRYSLMEPLRSP